MTEIPQYQSRFQLQSMPVVQYSTAGAKQLQSASQELGAFAQGMNQQAEKVERLRAQATMRENMHRISRESGADPAALQANLDGFKKEFISNLPSGLQAEFNELYRLESVSHIDMAANKYNDKLRADTSVEGMRNFTAITNNLQTATKLYETAQTPEARQAAADMMQNSLKDAQSVADLTDQEGMPLFSPAQRLAMGSEAIASPIKALSPKGQMLALNPPVGFESNLALIHGHEINPSDPDLVHPDGKGMAYRGINSDANPKEFAQIQTLLAAGKNMEARNLADQVYKTKYWDAHNIDSLPANVQGIVFDAAVNQGGKLANELVNMVKNGATPSQLLERRQEHYDSLKNKTPQERMSWAKRLGTFTPIALGENADLLDPDAKEQLRKGVQQSIEREEAMKMNDYGAWAQYNGMDVPTRVQAQAGRPFVQVVPNQQAKAIVESLGKYESADDFINFANQFKQEYAGGEDYAVGNLVDSGLPAEMEQAFFMAIENPNANKGYIDAIFKATLEAKDEKGGGINGALKRAGKKPDDIVDKAIEAYKDTELGELNKFKFNKSAQFKTDRQIRAITSIAQGYALNNPDKNEADAVKYAIGAFNKTNMYKFSAIDGQPYLIPTAGSNQQKPEDLSARMKEFYDKSLDLKMAVKERGTFFNKNIVPVLNDDENGYTFVDVTGEPVFLDKEKTRPLSVSMQELHDLYTPPFMLKNTNYNRSGVYP